MGIVEEVGAGATRLKVGDRVVVPFGIACGTCFMCRAGLQSQCETTQVRGEGKGAALFGYTRSTARCPAGRPSTCVFRMPTWDPSWCPTTARPTSATSISPMFCPPRGRPSSTRTFRRRLGGGGWAWTHWPDGCAHRAHRGRRDGDRDRLGARAARDGQASRHRGASMTASSAERRRRGALERTHGRGADAAIDAVGMEAHGSPHCPRGALRGEPTSLPQSRSRSSSTRPSTASTPSARRSRRCDAAG